MQYLLQKECDKYKRYIGSWVAVYRNASFKFILYAFLYIAIHGFLLSIQGPLGDFVYTSLENSCPLAGLYNRSYSPDTSFILIKLLFLIIKGFAPHIRRLLYVPSSCSVFTLCQTMHLKVSKPKAHGALIMFRNNLVSFSECCIPLSSCIKLLSRIDINELMIPFYNHNAIYYFILCFIISNMSECEKQL